MYFSRECWRGLLWKIYIKFYSYSQLTNDFFSLPDKPSIKRTSSWYQESYLQKLRKRIIGIDE